MTTRELTPKEKELVEQAWQDYLDSGTDLETEVGGWERYKDTLRDMNIIPTLAGYRKDKHAE